MAKPPLKPSGTAMSSRFTIWASSNSENLPGSLRCVGRLGAMRKLKVMRAYALMPHDLILTTGVVLMEFGRRLSRVFKIVILITLIVEVPSATAVSPVNINEATLSERFAAKGLRYRQIIIYMMKSRTVI